MTRAWMPSLALVLLAAGFGSAAGEEKPPRNDLAKVRYQGGFLFQTEDGRYSLRLTGGIQLRYTFLDVDRMVNGNGEDYSNFFIRRARLWAAGRVVDPKLTYSLHLQLEPTSQVNAHDLWLQYAFSDLVQLGAGRNKIAYGLEFLNSGMGLSLVDRSIMYGETDIERGAGTPAGGPTYPGGGTAEFGLSSIAPTGFPTGGMGLYRSQGVQLGGRRGAADRATFEYQLGLWQGRATRGLSNRGTGHLWAARVGWHPFGAVDWALQGDLARSPRLRLGLFASTFTNRDTGSRGDFEESGLDLAAAVRWRGFAVDAEWAEEAWDAAALEREARRRGWRLQVGWMLPGRPLELVVRTAEVDRLLDPDVAMANAAGLGVAVVRNGDQEATALERRLTEWTLGVAWYPTEPHRQKLVADVSWLSREFAADPEAGVARADDQTDARVRLMVQVMF